MGGSPPPCKMQRRTRAFALLLCFLFVQPSRAFFNARSAYVSELRGDSYKEEKVPMTVIVPDYSPRPAPLAAAAAPAPAPVPGSDDDMPRLPSERWSAGAPSTGNAGADAPTPTASAGASTAFIGSSPAVPLPAGVTDSATVLPMPTPGQEERLDVGMGTLLQARTVPLAVPLLVMLSFWALWQELSLVISSVFSLGCSKL